MKSLKIKINVARIAKLGAAQKFIGRANAISRADAKASAEQERLRVEMANLKAKINRTRAERRRLRGESAELLAAARRSKKIAELNDVIRDMGRELSK